MFHVCKIQPVKPLSLHSQPNDRRLQVQLQNMLTSKFIAHFLEEVSTWQRKLSTADQVIAIWFEVQRTWSHLESIFIGSEDIRSQLPEDSKRFDGIDKDFKELVKEVEKTTNVVEATNKPRLYERLEALQVELLSPTRQVCFIQHLLKPRGPCAKKTLGVCVSLHNLIPRESLSSPALLQADLALCEKALAEYLETKRLAFPRFYFVSSADLLDILSNGNNPTVVARHLTKLFDSMASLKFEQVNKHALS